MNYVLDVHTHTLASGHAFNTIREMAQAAAQKGLELLGITEHSMRMPGTCHEFYFYNLRMLEREMYGIEVLFGTELNIIDYEGHIDMNEKLLQSMDVVIASMHTPCLPCGSLKEHTRSYRKVMENPYVDIIGHPDDSRYPVDMEELVKGSKETGTLLEINNNSLDPRCTRTGAREQDRKLLKLCMKYQVPIIVGSDAHADTLVGRHDYAEELITELGFPEELIINRSVAELKKHLHKFM
ncbi:MAG: phosphatase [Lachnospiraceae bacterium]|jgi:putative hydrolase